MSQRTISVISIILYINFLLFNWLPVFAENEFLLIPPEHQCGAGVDKELKECTWNDVIGTIRNILGLITTKIAFFLVSLFVIIGAVMYMFGGPSPSTAERGKNLMINALKGYALVVLAAVILDLFLGFIQPQLAPIP